MSRQRPAAACCLIGAQQAGDQTIRSAGAGAQNPQRRTAAHVELAARQRLAHRRSVLACAVAQFMLVLDGSAVTIALPAIGRAFALSPAGLQWVLTAYVLPFGGLMLLGGRLTDTFGATRIFRGATFAFAAASAAAAGAPTAGVLYAARALEGIAGAALAPAALAQLITATPPGRERERALALNGSAVLAGVVTGFLAGGAVCALFGWRGVLMINVVVAIAMLGLSQGTASNSPTPIGRARFPAATSSLLATGGLVALLSTITSAASGRLSAGSGAIGVGGVAAIASCAALERRIAAPLIPVDLQRDKRLTTAASAAGAASAGIAGVLVVLVVYLQEVRGYSALGSAALISAPAFLAAAASIVSARILAEVTPGYRLWGGAGTQLLGTLALIAAMAVSSPLGIALSLACLAAGHIVAVTSVNIAVAERASARNRGLASAVVNAAVELGSATGIAVLFAVAAVGGTASRSAPHTTVATAASLRLAVAAAAIFAVIAVASGARLMALERHRTL